MASTKISDFEVLLRDHFVRSQTQRRPTEVENVRELPVPNLDYLSHDKVAQVAFSVLDKDQLAVSELSHRIQLRPSQIAPLLYRTSKKLGKAIHLYELGTSPRRVTLDRAFDASGALRGSYIAIGANPQHRAELAEYIVSSIADRSIQQVGLESTASRDSPL